MLVLPGCYASALTIDGKVYNKTFDVKLNPEINESSADLRKQFDFAQSVHPDLVNAFKIYEKINSIIKRNSSSAEIDSLSTLANKGEINFASEIGGLSDLITTVEAAATAPAQGQRNCYSP